MKRGNCTREKAIEMAILPLYFFFILINCSIIGDNLTGGDWHYLHCPEKVNPMVLGQRERERVWSLVRFYGSLWALISKQFCNYTICQILLSWTPFIIWGHYGAPLPLYLSLLISMKVVLTKKRSWFLWFVLFSNSFVLKILGIESPQSMLLLV